jgi:hypothetical protein
MRPSSKNIGRRLTPKQAAIITAQAVKKTATVKRFVAVVASVTDRETTGTITCSCAGVSNENVTVQVRANVDLAADDVIWIIHDPSAQDTFIFDGFVKGGGTGNNSANAPIPWTQSPGVTSPASSDLTIAATSGQTTIIGGAGDDVQFDGNLLVDLDDLQDVNAAAPSDGDVLAWNNGASEWQNATNPWRFDTDDLLVVGAEGDYATIALAIAAAASGDTILVDIGTWTCDAQTLPDGVNLIGVDRDQCILQTTSSSPVLTLGDGCYVANITIRNDRELFLGTTSAVAVGGGDTATCFNVKIIADNQAGTATGAWGINCAGTIHLRQCEVNGTAAAGASIYGLALSGTAYIYGGSLTGDTAGILNASGSCYFREPPYVDAISNSSGTFYGSHSNGSDLIAAGEESTGLMQASRNRYDPTWTVYGHFRNALASGFSWQGAPFATPTVSYVGDSYLFATTADADGAFLADAPSTWLGKFFMARVSVYYAADVGILIRKDATNFAEFYMTDPGTTGYFSLVVRYQASDDGIGLTSSTYDMRWASSEFCPMAAQIQDRGGGSWRLVPRLMTEAPGRTTAVFSSTADMTWTPGYIGVLFRPTAAAERGGYVDLIAGDVVF